ncbi:ABC transporter permease [Kaistia dalseonensis]|uniref:Ribose transport system permease protein n=1 Tax=Kaistia dalseonensis TaxID=410840 RepID=A0ABU0H412_9HYPH|nr:ABC transporter permease [Kaistia dalseonensis]MCX5494470.1 ABC transporter permease [Kaistia dalseonensis]MDQ0437049.1 ribose transport system permease protein [Kaistia dalseonensis]
MTATIDHPAPTSSRLRHLGSLRELALLLMIAALIAGMSILSPYFLTPANFQAIVVGMVPTAIIVVGMTILLVSGSFDLSVGSVLALSSTVVALLLLAKVPIPLAILAALLVGVGFGLANGLIVTMLGVNPLIATLGTMSIARGAALVFTEGFSLSSLPPAFGVFGKTQILGLPLMAWIMVAIVIAGDVALRRTRFLRQVYFIGGSEKAAALSGIAVNRVRIVCFVVSGLLASVAGVLLASRLMSGTPTAGNGLELQALAAAVIGGASLRGGEGTIFGAVLGVVFVALISNAMTMLAVSMYWQMIVTGLVLVIAVAVDMLTRRKS